MQCKNFFMISNKIFNLGLKPRDFIVYCCLVKHKDNENNTCFPSRSTIAKECCIDAKTVDAAVKNLTASGLVQKINRKRVNGSHTSNLYVVNNLLEVAEKPP